MSYEEKRKRILRSDHRNIMATYKSDIKNPLEKQLARYKKHMEVNKNEKNRKVNINEE